MDDYQHSFDPEQYYKQNYLEGILPEDAFLIEFATHVLRDGLGVAPRTFGRVIDVGNAGVLIGPGMLAPFVRDDGQMVLMDTGSPQMRQIAKTLRSGRRGNLGLWQKYQDLFARHGLWQDCLHRVCQLGVAERRSVFELEPNDADAGAMFYVAESITPDRNRMTTAVHCFLDAIRPGGLVVWAAMIESEGYDSPGALFSATAINPQDMLELAKGKVGSIRVGYIESSHGARRTEGPQYSGMAILVGVKK